MNEAQKFAPEPVTPMTAEYFNMLVVWSTNNSHIGTQGLADNLIRRFGLQPGTAWILAARFKNEMHTRATQ